MICVTFDLGGAQSINRQKRGDHLGAVRAIVVRTVVGAFLFMCRGVFILAFFFFVVVVAVTNDTIDTRGHGKWIFYYQHQPLKCGVFLHL